jgi:hypothetical protein
VEEPDNNYEKKIITSTNVLGNKKKIYNATIASQRATPGDEMEIKGKIWSVFDKNNNLFKKIHFNKLLLLTLIHQIEEEEGGAVKRGRICEYTLADSTIMYFVVMTSPETLVGIGDLYSIKPSTLTKLLIRVRPLLLSSLNKIVSIPRPVYTEETGPTGLIVDSTSIPIPRPTGTFNEKKQLYSVHHHTYAYNFECAQNPQTHVCLKFSLSSISLTHTHAQTHTHTYIHAKRFHNGHIFLFS